ncbi:hypothetical protein ACF07Y_43000 [Streptomyces sp. NPDC016566]|uniref:hypothetical protein n=1 Tax=Streptomyces sp. NPDC016566 TaxID=3364967 RepID=UPI0036F74384
MPARIPEGLTLQDAENETPADVCAEPAGQLLGHPEAGLGLLPEAATPAPVHTGALSSKSSA